MSVFINGMGMPKYGDTFKVYLDAADDVLLVDTSDSSRFYTLVEVKTPHGRLIDADALLRYKGDCYDSDGHLLYAVGTGNIMCAPTIIEAEGNDG